MNNNVRVTTLDNGFRIVTERMPGLKSASLGVWVSAGCRNERLQQNGIAHFLEHMAFKGTKKRNALQIAEAIEDVGGYINAYTSREMTAYYVRVLEDDVPLALDVISDIVLNSVFDPKELEIERGVILQEIGQSLDTPDDIIFDWLQDTAYPDQAMGRAILGSTENVRSFSREDLQNFVTEHYGPEQMVLSAAGSVDHDALVEEARSLFGDLNRTPKFSNEPSKFIGGEVRVIKDLEQAHFALSFESASYLDDNIYTAQIYSTALGGGMSSRLFQEIREKRGLCYSIYASAGAFADSGMMTIYSGTSSNDISGLANITIDEIKRSASDMTDEEVARSRSQMKAGMLMGLEGASARCERLARTILIFNRVPDLDEIVSKIDAVNAEHVKEFAQNLCNSSVAYALYGPVKNAPDVSELEKRLVG
ncbi:insulinase family protein [Amylibacter sp.]|nr:insulinase family protein [Amylibacter sp.]MDA9073982.1 insulinase family protein [Amylibacter sp.]MDA9242774.1 insulinase family protein [Amylibacter sp.]MDA9354542.1 insulinase family protein [Amylibacter sp.]MDA9925875.1 insulinase family protein [Amylibacter sp.]|tara:strand:+ start:5876 stop:7141 length:1266 start_codon:yes stop_codon:yes gene_type:complete